MDSMQQHTIQIFMWAWYPESAKIHQKVSAGFWRIQDTCMSNIYTGGFWWIQDTSILCVTKLVDFGGFRILSSKNTQGVRVKILKSGNTKKSQTCCFWETWNEQFMKESDLKCQSSRVREQKVTSEWMLLIKILQHSIVKRKPWTSIK